MLFSNNVPYTARRLAELFSGKLFYKLCVKEIKLGQRRVVQLTLNLKCFGKERLRQNASRSKRYV